MIDELDPDDFPGDYQYRMIRAYPVIAGLTADELFYADPAERDQAFRRILAAKNLRRTHELFLGAPR